MNTSYRDAMDALRFTREQKENMVENLMAAPAGRTVRPLRLRRFAAGRKLRYSRKYGRLLIWES